MSREAAPTLFLKNNKNLEGKSDKKRKVQKKSEDEYESKSGRESENEQRNIKNNYSS